jgi:hypothetical protein
MATITKSIGTTGRDYSTVAGWEAALNGDAGGAGNSAVGQMYPDTDFDETVTIDDATPDDITLEAASTYEHGGVEDGGVRFLQTGDGIVLDVTTTLPINLIGFEIDMNSNADDGSTNHGAVTFDGGAASLAKRLMIHGMSSSGFGVSGHCIGVGFNDDAKIVRCALYDIQITGNGTAATGRGVEADGASSVLEIESCTIHDIQGKATGYGIDLGTASPNSTVNNTVVTNTEDACYFDAGTDPTASNNADDDSTILGAIATNPVAAGTEYVSDSSPFDLNLNSGAECVDAATTLDSDALLDIALYDVANDGDDDPDVGAYEYQVAAAGGGPGSYVLGGGMVV